MSRRLVFVLILIVMLEGLLSGCGISNPFKGWSLRKKDAPAAEKQSFTRNEPEKAVEERVNLINDTVVDVFRQPDVESERVTQGIYNQTVTVMEENGGWTQVKVADGYTGWIKSKYLNKDEIRKADGHKFKLVVTGKSKKVYTQPQGGLTLKEVTMGTEFLCTDEHDGWYKVELPGGIAGWLDSSSTIRIPVKASIPITTANDFITTARKFMKTSYLWGGISFMGIDCSGLTYICSRMNGVDLPRDADQQVNSGVKIAIESIQPGDLLFFSTNTDLKDISHVGIFTGENQFIHASNSRGAVVIGTLKDDYFARRLVAVRRIF